MVNFSPFYRLLQAVFFLVYMPLIFIYNFLVFGLRVEGRKNLRRAGKRGVILISNHSLYLDPAVIMQTLFPRRAYYYALKSHFRHPVGGYFIRLLGGIPIPGAMEMRRALRTTREALDRGYNVHFFPEGEMKHMNQQLAAFQDGAFYQALRLDAPVVPVTLVHRPRTLLGKQVSRYFIRVICVVGSPVEGEPGESETLRDASSRLAAEAHQSMAATITSGHQRMQAGQAAISAK